jgi:Fe-S cluster biogenesis protein NfuA
LNTFEHFSYPQKAAMQDVAQRWEAMVLQEGGTLGFVEWANEGSLSVTNNEQNYYYDEDDDDDDDEFEWDDAETTTAAGNLFVDETKKPKTSPTSSSQVISPFQEVSSSSSSSSSVPTSSNNDHEEKLPFNRESVDKVLDEIRPYLISDGGNVSVHSIDETTQSVYLTLEGACGSCASSTVTMQMGIERILREKFDNLGKVEQGQPSDLVVGDSGDLSKKGLTMEAVMKEINRIGPAITAMGGMVEVLNVDEELGVVEVRFRGANKVQQGLELALRDVPYVKHVKFIN